MAKLPGAIQGARIVGERFVHSQRQANPEGRMPLMDHIRELRNRVVKIALALVGGMVLGYVFFDPIWNFITRPYCRAVGGCHTGSLGHTLAVSSPLDGFYLHIKVAFVVGVILTSPVWLYQIWAFVAPGLYAREKRWTYIFLGTAVPLFLLGCYFALLVMGRGLHFLIGMVPQNTVAIFDRGHLHRLLHRDDPGLRAVLRAPALPGDAQPGRPFAPRAVQEVAPRDDLLRVRVRGDRLAEPGSRSRC